MKSEPWLKAGVAWALCAGLAGCASDPARGPLGTPDFPAQPCLTLRGCIPLAHVEGRLDHMAADPKSPRMFVAALENHSVEVIDLARQARVHSIVGLREPQGILVDAASRRLLVCCRGDGTCRSFDADTYEEGPWVDLGRNADNIRQDSPRGVVYAGSGAEPGTGLLSAMELASLTPASRGGKPGRPRSGADLLPDRPRQADVAMETVLDAHPESFQIDAATHRIFVNVPDGHHIAVVAVQTNGMAVAAKWPVPGAEKNFPLALDAASARLFVVCRKPACVLVFDTRTGQIVSRIPCVGDCDDVYFDAAAQRLYVIGGEGFVDVFGADAGTGTLAPMARVPTAPKARTGLFIPRLRMLAVVAPQTARENACIRLFDAAP